MSKLFSYFFVKIGIVVKAKFTGLLLKTFVRLSYDYHKCVIVILMEKCNVTTFSITTLSTTIKMIHSS